MPRLTRMQKFAEKREQLANDKEEKIISSSLSSYQDRLNNIQDTLSFSEVEIKEETEDKEINPDYVWKPFEDDSFSQPVEPIFAWEGPTFDEVQVQEEVKISEEAQLETVEEAQPETVEEAKPETVEEAKPVEETAPAEEKHEDDSFFNQFIGEPQEENNDTSNFESYFETLNDESSKGVFTDVSDDSGEIVSQKERETYLNQTMSDVFSHNINNGEETIDSIVDNFVDEVRHGEARPEPIEDTESIEVVENAEPVQDENVDPIDNTYFESLDPAKELDADELEEENPVDDEEFSNTVSMEISKIMDEIAAAPAAPQEEAPVIEETPVQEEAVQINDAIVEENPEEVVEIKNISEVENEPAKDTMSSTIPFVVAAEDDLDDEEDEEDGSNTVLNVILIVLIVVLVAVLGLIVFYILKTKGIF